MVVFGVTTPLPPLKHLSPTAISWYREQFITSPFSPQGPLFHGTGGGRWGIHLSHRGSLCAQQVDARTFYTAKSRFLGAALTNKDPQQCHGAVWWSRPPSLLLGEW